MTSFKDQIEAARAAHLAAVTLEGQVRKEIVTAFESWDEGDLSATTIRHELEAIIRKAYRTSAAVAATHAGRMAEIPGWMPQAEIFRTEYLDSLVKDVQRNLREYKKSDREDKARRRHILRLQHSAGVAAQRGYTDALIAAHIELEDFGYTQRKVWVANFLNNTPCPICRGLHGTEVPLRDNFPAPTEKPGVYVNLVGPPRHPRCKCFIVILIVTLDNLFEKLDIDNPVDDDEPEEMDTDAVKNLPWRIFSSIIKALKTLVSFVTKV